MSECVCVCVFESQGQTEGVNKIDWKKGRQRKRALPTLSCYLLVALSEPKPPIHRSLVLKPQNVPGYSSHVYFALDRSEVFKIGRAHV